MSRPAPARDGGGCWGCAGSLQGKRWHWGTKGALCQPGRFSSSIRSLFSLLLLQHSCSGAEVTPAVLGQSLEGGSALFWWGSDPAQTHLGGAFCTPNPAPTMLGDPEGRAGSRAGHSLGMEPASSAWLVSKAPWISDPPSPSRLCSVAWTQQS